MKATNASALVAIVSLPLCALLLVSAPAVADEADDLISEILRNTRSRPEAARKILESAGLLTDAPEVQARLAVKAYEYAMSSSTGYPTALAAMDLLEKVAPRKIETWRDKRLEVYRQQYLRGSKATKIAVGPKYVECLLARAGRCGKAGKWPEAAKHYRLAYQVAGTLSLPEKTAIYASLRTAEGWVAVANRVASLKAAIKKDPADRASRQRLVETYLVDLDRPKEAVKYLTDALDPVLRKNVALAAKEASELVDADFLTLGQWYRALAAKTAIKPAKARLLTRSRDNLKMYLEVYTKKDLQWLRVRNLLKTVEAELAGVGTVSAVGSVGWTNVLGLVDPAKHAVTGTWSRKGRYLLCSDTRYALATIPITAVGSYDLQLAFTMKEGRQCRVILPVGAAQVALSLSGYPGYPCGLEMVNNMSLSSGNPTVVRSRDRQPLFPIGARTAVDVAVRIKGALADVTVKLNGKKIIAWSGKQSSLTMLYTMALPSKTFALGVYRSTVTWHTARLRRLDAADRMLKWVSKDATYRLSSTYSIYAPKATFVTGEGKLHSSGMAFQTSSESSPYVIVILKKTERVKRIILTNRRGSYSRSSVALAMEVSADGRKWTGVWSTTTPQSSWIIELKTPLRTRYIRIRRPKATSSYGGYLALAGIRVYAVLR